MLFTLYLSQFDNIGTDKEIEILFGGKTVITRSVNQWIEICNDISENLASYIFDVLFLEFNELDQTDLSPLDRGLAKLGSF